MPPPRPPKAAPPKAITPEYLERAALHHLERFATSAENFRRVLMRKVDRAARAHPDMDRDQAAAWIDALIARYVTAGLLNDSGYAEMKVGSLHRRGASTRAIREKLSAKGVARDHVDKALEQLDEDTEGTLDHAAALALARRRRLGPFRPAAARAAMRDKDLASLGRAGFDYATARSIIDAENGVDDGEGRDGDGDEG